VIAHGPAGGSLMAKAAIHDDAGSLTVTVPMKFRKRGGRKLVISPTGADAWAPARARVDNAMVKALARAHRWQKLLHAGHYQTVRDLAEAENINPSYVARTLRLTLLAPHIVEAILDGRHDPERVTLERQPIMLHRIRRWRSSFGTRLA